MRGPTEKIEAPETKFKVGDVVKLRSGGPPMTVIRVRDDGIIETRWFVSVQFHVDYFQEPELVIAEEIA